MGFALLEQRGYEKLVLVVDFLQLDKGKSGLAMAVPGALQAFARNPTACSAWCSIQGPSAAPRAYWAKTIAENDTEYGVCGTECAAH